MADRNQLFFIVFGSFLLVGCGSLPRPPEPSVPPLQAAAAPSGNDILFHALSAAGVDYRHGGRSQQAGFDCSGLVAFVYREAYGLALPHHTQAQSELGESVSASELQPGDLVFFNTQRKPFSHVGIYIGEGRFIHAPREGSVVRNENLRARYWSTRFDGARRLVPMAIAAASPAPPKKNVVTYP
jgi:cell wall-associated NlpC family hydrolase